MPCCIGAHPDVPQHPTAPNRSLCSAAAPACPFPPSPKHGAHLVELLCHEPLQLLALLGCSLAPLLLSLLGRRLEHSLNLGAHTPATQQQQQQQIVLLSVHAGASMGVPGIGYALASSPRQPTSGTPLCSNLTPTLSPPQTVRPCCALGRGKQAQAKASSDKPICRCGSTPASAALLLCSSSCDQPQP